MKLLSLNMFFLCMIVLVFPFVEEDLLWANSDRPATRADEQSQASLSLAEKSLNDFPILLAGVRGDQCRGGCNSDLQSCVERCPGFDESNVVDPKYATRKCKNVCDAALSQCKSGCPKD